MKKLNILFLLVLLSVATLGQDLTVFGRVTAFGEVAVSNFPVRAKKSGMETLTDSSGFFSLKCNMKDQLIFKGKPFVTQKIRIEVQDSVNVNLLYVDGDMSRELIVDNGFMSPDDIEYAITELSQQNNNYHQYSNIYELLSGQFSSIEIVDGNRVYIRGQAPSLTLDNSALLIVNGLEVRGLSNVEPMHVKSIQVLKGTDAAFYGSRGANGVVVITMK